KNYHCGYCKKFFQEVSQLIAEDKNVKIVFREFPILSEDSRLASKAALAVNSIDKNKYLAFHTALMNFRGEFTIESLISQAKELGIDEATFKKAFENPEIDKQIESNRELAKSLDISGTPAIIIDNEIAPGAIPYSQLKEKVENSRINKGKTN
ncbi:MAG: DsbA family protein, partial [Pseudomonadota bacterium]